ncbi:MAG: homoserine kinase [Ferrovum sp.]|nr:homoserine kinase [Ferrovum sp.]NDU86879.1 homoserine kinase [Ferrovum sp.]
MAVFTPVSPEELSPWIRGYHLGEVLSLTPISSGIENTNYFVTTQEGHYVLTLFEKLALTELPYYLGLMDHLAQQGLPCARPCKDESHQFVSLLKNKPATLVSRLEGTSVQHPTAHHCAAIGQIAARLHRAAHSYLQTKANPRGADWRQITAVQVRPFLDQRQGTLLTQAMEMALPFDPALPSGTIHADLFRDNVLFSEHQVSGLIDFYFAGTDNWLYDLAIIANDWCVTDQADFAPPRLQALLTAYCLERPLSAAERKLWPRFLITAGLRFWLSRLFDRHLPRSGAVLHPHDPGWFERILRFHLEHPSPWLP